MKRAWSFLLICSFGFAAPPPGYYDSVQGRAGQELFAGLHSIISDHHVVPYSSGSQTDTSDALATLDQTGPNSTNVFLGYAQKESLIAFFGITTGWNREHRWPNSYGLDGVEPAYSDLFNLHAEDANVNSSRQNKFFDESNAADPSYSNPAHPEAPACSSDSDSWEPPESIKGDIARSIFYMATRYTGDRPNEPLLSLTDDAAQITSANTRMGKLSTLLVWHQRDPPDDQERLRNDRIYSLYQTNRNPFIDHPEWVNLVFSPPHTNSPRLQISVQAGQFSLAWFATNQAVALESATNVNGMWASVTNMPILTNGTFVLTFADPAPSQFFRLRVN